MMFTITVRGDHPTGVVDVDGIRFYSNSAKTVPALTKKMRENPDLIIVSPEGRLPAPLRAAPAAPEDPAPLLKLLNVSSVGEGIEALQLFLDGEQHRQDELATLKTDHAAFAEHSAGQAARIAELEEMLQHAKDVAKDQIDAAAKQREISEALRSRVEELESALAEATKKKGGRGGSSD